MGAVAAALVGRWRSIVILLLGLVASGAILATAGSESTTATGRTDALPAGVDSTRVVELQDQLPRSEANPALVVFSRVDGQPLTAQDQAALVDVGAGLQRFSNSAEENAGPPVIFSEDATVGLTSVNLRATPDVTATSEIVDEIRAAARADVPAGVQAQVTGPAGVQADIANLFDGANVTLLAVTASVVALLLIVTYRSPWLWLVPLIVIGLADRVAVVLALRASDVTGIPIDEAGTGILSVLVFGAGTDYALLLIARYRDELRLDPDRFVAMRRALARSFEPLIGSAATVVLALLTLLLSLVPTTRGLGLAGAIGIVTALVFALVLLPSALVVFGRGLFWPFIPRVGDALSADRAGVWGRLGALVSRRPAAVVVMGGVLLAAMAAGLLSSTIGLAQNDQFRTKPEALVGQETLSRGFPAGASDPVVVVTTPASQEEVTRLASQVSGVASAQASASSADLAQVDVVLTSTPGTEEAYQGIRDLRAALVDVPGAYVGGTVAQQLDAQEAAQRDQRVIIPLILLVVFAVLVTLLRALVAPVLLVVTVVATFLASLGLSWWIFSGVFGFPAIESSVPLLSFLFLVALGVDYNIFLVTRAREDALTRGTKAGMLRALAATGGVITSAGILLAAVFAVLGVLPLVTLTQIGVIVCVGVLLDTLLVRTIIVPALAILTGDRFWWPSRAIDSSRITSGPGLEEGERVSAST